MNRTSGRLIIATLVAFAPALYGQELTQAQVQAAAARKAAIASAQSATNTVTLTAAQAAELAAMEQKNSASLLALSEDQTNAEITEKSLVKSGAPKSTAAAGLNGGADSFMPMFSQVQSGTSYIQALIQSLGIASNQMYGVGAFNDGFTWKTTNNQTTFPFLFYPWAFTPRTLTPTNGDMAVSYGYGLGGMSYGDEGLLWCPVPDTVLRYTNTLIGKTNTDRQDYILQFKYILTNYSSSVFYRCATDPSGGILITNMSSSQTNWAQATAVLTNISYPYMYWVLVDSSVSSPGPTAELDAVQFIPIPPPSSNDFAISGLVNSGSNVTATLQWNTLPYSHFHREYAESVLGPWATNTAPYGVTNYVAGISFTNGLTDNRFYRMAHN